MSIYRNAKYSLIFSIYISKIIQKNRINIKRQIFSKIIKHKIKYTHIYAQHLIKIKNFINN